MSRKVRKQKANKYKKHKGDNNVSITLAMGVFEMIMMLFIKRFKKTKKVVWLRVQVPYRF